MTVQTAPADRFSSALQRLQELCSYSGGAKSFWSAALSVLSDVTDARGAVLLRGGAENGGWKRVVSLPTPTPADAEFQQFSGAVEDVAEMCSVKGIGHRGWESATAGRPSWCLGARLASLDEEPWVAVFFLPQTTHAAAEEALRRVRLLSHLPLLNNAREHAGRSETAVSHFAAVLELMSKLNEQQRFVAVSMTLCDELAARHGCDRVSLGWLEKEEYVQIKAISHSEKFEKKTEAMKVLAAAMEEALDQREILVWPAPEEQRLVTRDHAWLVENRGTKFICTLPLWLEGEGVAALTCERNTQPFTEVEVRLLSLCSDMAGRRLAELKDADRWFGARWATAARHGAGKLLGPEHTLAKLSAALGVVALGYAIFGGLNYRLDASFIMRTENAAYLSAPFSSYLDEVKAEIGTEVKKGMPLASLDTRDLLLEEAGALADQTRYVREADKASAGDKIADMRIAEAQAEQARARLELARFKRKQAVVTAPFDGVVVEGDLKKRIGAPVKQGDVLFKIARTDLLYLECAVKEQDVHELRVSGTGEMTFASAPKYQFPVRIEQIEPVGQTKEEGNVFLVHCIPTGPREAWWRPGMTGVAKLDAGRRAPGWIALHRTIDFLRLHLWW